MIDRQTGERTPLDFPLPRGNQSSELTIPSSVALQAQFTADSQAIVVRIGRNVHLFDSGGQWLRRIRLNRAGADEDRRLSSSEVNSDATIIAVTKEESILELYSLLDGELIGAPLVHPAPIARIAFDSSGTTVATASADGLVRFWALPGRWPDDVDEISQRIAAHTGMVLSRSGEVLHREFTNQGVGQSVWTAVAEHQRQQHSSLVTGALDALARQSFSDAQIGLEKCAQRYPNHWQYRLLQIRPLVEQGRIDEAEKIVEVVRRQIGDATVRLWLEKNLHQLGIKADQGPYDDDFARQLVWHREQLIKVQPSEVFRQALLFELINEDENSFSPHEQLAYLNEFLELRASEPQMLIRRAALLERLHRWDEAIRDYKRVAELDPDQHFHQYRLLALYLFVDDQESFLSAWQQMFDKWADTTEKRIPERLAKPALLLGRDNEGLQFALKLADRAFKERHKEERYEAYDLVAKGFAEYRRGDFQSAINYLNESIAIFESGVNPYAPALNYFFVAMAQHQLGSTDAALESYQTGVDRNETYYDYIVNNSNFMVDWLFAETARRQAASVLGIELDQAIFPVPPLPETESWVTLFEDNFDRNDLGDDWSEEEAWSIEDGAIRGQVGLGKSSRGRRYDTTIELLGHEVPRVAEITYQTWWSQPLLSELKIASDEYPSYVVGLSGVTHLYRTPFGESGKGPHLRDYFVIGKRRDGSDILGARWTAIRPNIELPAGQHYQIRIVQQPEHVRVFIDDEEVISERITAQTGRTLILYGNGPADASVYFDNLRIRTPAPSSKRSD